jgi:tetratricopeptide (TPR) repeat protein
MHREMLAARPGPQRLLPLGLLALVLATALDAVAADPLDPKDEAAAQALYTQATAEMDAKSFETACPKLEEATRLVPAGIGARTTLAECYEGMGRLASAWSTLEIARSLAERAGQKDRAAQIAEKAAALRPRLAFLTVTVPPSVRGLPGLVVHRDGVTLGAVFDTPLPVDRGTHSIEVRAKGYLPFKAEVRIAADGVRETVNVPGLRPDAGAGAPAASPAPGWPRKAGFVALGAGAAGLVAAGVLAGLAVGKKDESNAGPCDAGNICDNEGLELRAQAVSLANGATAALVVGGVLAAGGLALVLVAPSPGPAKQPVKAARVSLGPGSVWLRGSF